ncbi:MAG: four helix bundle protein [Bacteroidota bacterium]|nr:four helix bundle protein [Bacteroidota bacterium]
MKEIIKQRTKSQSVTILKALETMGTGLGKSNVSNQLIRSSMSVGANYRAACRARSDKEFISKLSIVLEESDETLYWLEIIQEMNWLPSESLSPLIAEANELTAIFVSSLKTVKERLG